MTYLVTEFGKPFTANGFGNWFRDRCDEAGLAHCTAYGLRKAGATIATENGATDRQLMALYDWTTSQFADVCRAPRARAVEEQTLAHCVRSVPWQSFTPAPAACPRAIGIHCRPRSLISCAIRWSKCSTLAG
jgi:hypothetical protein